MTELPDSFDLRLVDRPALDEVQRAIAAADLPAVVALSEKALTRMRDPSFRRWPGRLASLDWCEVYEGALSYLLDVVRSGGETLPDSVDAAGAPLTAGYAAPSFQADYPLLVRGGEWTEWTATRHLTDERTRVRLFRLLGEPPPWLEVKVEVAEPCSFVSLGFLDGGILRAVIAADRSRFERLLSAAVPIRHGYSDVNWVAPASWLSDLEDVIAPHVRGPLTRWAEQLELLQLEAASRGHDILIGSWYGQASALTPADWPRMAG